MYSSFFQNVDEPPPSISIFKRLTLNWSTDQFNRSTDWLNIDRYDDNFTSNLFKCSTPFTNFFLFSFLLKNIVFNLIQWDELSKWADIGKNTKSHVLLMYDENIFTNKGHIRTMLDDRWMRQWIQNNIVIWSIENIRSIYLFVLLSDMFCYNHNLNDQFYVYSGKLKKVMISFREFLEKPWI